MIVGHPYFFIIILIIVNMERIKAVIAVIVGHSLFAFFNGNSKGKKKQFCTTTRFPCYCDNSTAKTLLPSQLCILMAWVILLCINQWWCRHNLSKAFQVSQILQRPISCTWANVWKFLKFSWKNTHTITCANRSSIHPVLTLLFGVFWVGIILPVIAVTGLCRILLWLWINITYLLIVCTLSCIITKIMFSRGAVAT